MYRSSNSSAYHLPLFFIVPLLFSPPQRLLILHLLLLFLFNSLLRCLSFALVELLLLASSSGKFSVHNSYVPIIDASTNVVAASSSCTPISFLMQVPLVLLIDSLLLIHCVLHLYLCVNFNSLLLFCSLYREATYINIYSYTQPY